MRISDWSSDVCSSDLTQGVACGDRSDNRAACPDHVRILGDCRARNRHRAWRQMALALAGLRAACAGEGRDVAMRQLYPLHERDGTRRSALVVRSEEHTSELQSLMRISYPVFCLTKKRPTTT